MTKRAASEDALGELHNKVTQVMKRALEIAEERMEPKEVSDEDEIILPADINPALLGAVTNFLKQNSITADTGAIQELSATERRLKEKAERRGNVVSLQNLPLSEDEAANG
jgi:hypothetical protein